MKKLLLLHFNDVYNVEPAQKEPKAGAARLATLVKGFAEEHPLVLFSGDCLSPSQMSTITRGKQMMPVLNAIGVHAACLGNHDLDFGLDHFVALSKQCNFPWLVANVIDKDTGRRLGDLEETLMMEWNGIRVGLMGLVEREWLSTLATIDAEDIEYHDFAEVGRRCALALREDGAELIVALTHMREPNDIHLLKSVAEIDVVMGGHDHGYHTGRIDPHNNLLIKSGTDFRDLTKIQVEIDDDGGKDYQWEHLVASGDVAEDAEVKGIVDQFVQQMGATLDAKIGVTAVDLDGRFANIRTGETNLGNFVCDVLRSASRSEICFLNSGTFRSDRIHPKGEMTKRDLVDILPMVDETVVMKLTGRQLLSALENSVSQFPKLEGRFLQVSGIRFAFDPSMPSGQRIVQDSVFIVDRNASLQVDAVYTVCTKAYLATGKDGFDVLKEGEIIVDSEESPVLPMCVRYHFMKLDVLNVWRREVTGATCAWVKRFAARMKQSIQNSDDKTPTASQIAAFDETFHAYVIASTTEERIVQLGSLN